MGFFRQESMGCPGPSCPSPAIQVPLKFLPLRFACKKSPKVILFPAGRSSSGGVSSMTDSTIMPITVMITRLAINMPFQLRSLLDVATSS